MTKNGLKRPRPTLRLHTTACKAAAAHAAVPTLNVDLYGCDTFHMFCQKSMAVVVVQLFTLIFFIILSNTFCIRHIYIYSVSRSMVSLIDTFDAAAMAR